MNTIDIFFKNNDAYVCESCNNSHDGSFGSGRFCSRSCANKRNHSEETKQKTSNTLKKRIKENGKYGALLEENRAKNGDKQKETWHKKLMEEDTENLKFERLRRRIILEQSGKCNRCGISEWLGQELSLELEHKDGNNKNNKRENLEALCPNCHSLTKTWRGRGGRGQKATEDEIIEAWKTKKYKNINQLLLGLNMAPKGKNYTRIKKIFIKNKIIY